MREATLGKGGSVVVRVVGTRAQPCLARCAAPASLSESFLLKGTGDGMVGMMSVVEVFGQSGSISVLKFVYSGFAYDVL